MIACIAVAFISGQLFGANAQVDHQDARVETQAIMQTTIAVINADTGSIVDGERQNFSAAIIDTLGDDFVLVSPAMAYTGLTSGMYGAVITFPSHVSERVLSFNTQNPEQIRLEFQINPNLPEQDFIETHTRIMDLQMAINTTIAYTYVSSILDQFHAAQDEVDMIFLNDLAHLEALGIVNMEQFTASLQLDTLPNLPLDLNAPVTSHFLTSVTDFAELVADMYQSSFDSAVEDYLYMRSGLIAMTEHFPEQEREWMDALEVWSDIFAQYGADLQAYSSLVRNHQMALENWYMQASFWNEDLMGQQENLGDWFDDISYWNDYLLEHERDSFDWFLFASNWSDDLTMYQLDLESWHIIATMWNEQLISHDISAMEWLEEALSWHEESENHKIDMLDWLDILGIWNYDAGNWFDASQYYIDALDDFGQDVYAILTYTVLEHQTAMDDLDNWLYDFQNDILDVLFYLIDDYNYAVDEMAIVFDNLTDWQDDLNDYVYMLQSQITSLQSAISSMQSAIVSIQTTIPPITFASDDPVAAYQQRAALQSWRNGAVAIVNSLSLPSPTFSLIPQLDPDTPVIDILDIPYEWDPYIILPDLLLDVSLYIGDFTIPTVAIPSPQYNPPAFEGASQPYMLIEPPELITEQPPEPPTLETDQPDNPPQITELPPLSAIQPVINQPGDPSRLDAYQPDSPLIGRPPRADDFWDSLNDMHRQLMRFDVDDYLTSAYRWEVQRLLRDYERYLDYIRFDLASQFDDNVDMLLDIRFGYTDFLSDLRTDAIQAEADTIDQLHNTLDIFTQRIEDTSEDTRDRLQAFAGMMPESRTPLGPNRNLTRFTVAPFDIVTPQIRELTAIVEVEAETIAPTFENHLWIAIAVLGGVFVITVGSYGITWLRKKGGE